MARLAWAKSCEVERQGCLVSPRHVVAGDQLEILNLDVEAIDFLYFFLTLAGFSLLVDPSFSFQGGGSVTQLLHRVSQPAPVATYLSHSGSFSCFLSTLNSRDLTKKVVCFSFSLIPLLMPFFCIYQCILAERYPSCTCLFSLTYVPSPCQCPWLPRQL